MSGNTFEKLKWPPSLYYNFATDVIDLWASEEKNKVAMLWTDGYKEIKLTFKDISQQSQQFANALAKLGCKKDDIVLLIMGREIQWWIVLTACLRMGAVCSPGTTQLSKEDIAYRVKAAGATCIVTDDDNAQKVDQVAEECPTLKIKIKIGNKKKKWQHYDSIIAQEDPLFQKRKTKYSDRALCYFTSGTTGYPKMTIHNHGYGYAHQITGKYWLDLRPEDLHWNISDNGWAKAAYSSYFGPWNQGAALFISNNPVFTPEETIKTLKRYPISTMCGAPTVYRMLIQQDLTDFSSRHLRHCVGAGEPLNPEVIESWKESTGLTIRDGYGQTETVLICGNLPHGEIRLGSMGKPMPDFEMAIIGGDGEKLGFNEEGDIAIKNPSTGAPGLFVDYYKDRDRYARCFVKEWYITGDRGMVDEDGFFWFVSRADDVILSAGYRIGPFEVESALLKHPAVIESAVVSSPDETRGAVVKAFVILGDEYTPNEEMKKILQEHVKTITAPYKYPRKIEFVKSLPKTVSGKIRRIELREREGG